jgi:hypothetical protein
MLMTERQNKVLMPFGDVIGIQYAYHTKHVHKMNSFLKLWQVYLFTIRFQKQVKPVCSRYYFYTRLTL